MSTKRIQVLIGVFLLMLPAMASTGQTLVPAEKAWPGLWLGVGGGYGFSIQTIADPGLICNSDPECPYFTGGHGGGLILGLSGDWRFANQWGMLFRANYFAPQVTMQSLISNANTLNQNGQVVPLVRDHTLTINRTSLGMDIMPEFRVDPFRIFAGADIAFQTSTRWQASAAITSPGNVTYAGGSRDTLFFPETNVPNAQSLLFSAIAGIGLDLPLSKRLELSPEVSVSYTLNSLRTDIPWRELTIGLMASLRYRINSESAPMIVPPPAPPIPQQVPYVALRIWGIDSSGARLDTIPAIDVNMQYVTHAFPLLPYIFFSSGSSAIPDRYQQLNSSGEFRMDEIGSDALSLNRAMLNIIGSRMKADPSATIAIHGYADKSVEQGNCALAEARAKEVRAYIARIWGIDESRMQIVTSGKNCVPQDATAEQSESHAAENRRVEITSNDESILMPVERKRFLEVKNISPPSLEFDPAGSATSGIASWKLTAVQGDSTLSQWQGQGALQESKLHSILNQQAINMRSGSDIVATLSLVDSQGRTGTAVAKASVTKDTLPIAVQRLTLTFFKINEDKIRPKDSLEMMDFFRNLQPTDSLSFKGYTDSLGTPRENLELSERRARSVYDFWKSTSGIGVVTDVHGVGSTQMIPKIPSYSTPEERFLSRTVLVEIRRRE